MARTIFDQEKQNIRNEILLLGNMVEKAVMESVGALKDNDLERSRLVLLNDRHINRKRYEIEISTIVLIATQQPAAGDLRRLAASLDICTELERMGDYAKGIANINLRSGGLGMPGVLKDIYSMGGKSVDMLHRAMIAFADDDLRIAQMLVAEDELIDECYTALYHDAVNYVLGDGRNIERSNYVIWAAHNLERLGDRVTNICERVIYTVTGERPESSLNTGRLWFPSLRN